MAEVTEVTEGEGTPDTAPASYYRPVGSDTYQPSSHTQGAWRPDEQHMGPVSGLLTHALATHEPRPDLQLARITFDILGMIPAAASRIRTRTVRPGRTIELVEATMSAGGRDVVRASAWRLTRSDTAAVAGGADDRLPPPAQTTRWDGSSVWAGGYIASLDIRRVDPPAPGRARAWIRARPGLIEGVAVDPLARFVTLVDTANGIATRADPRRWTFPNTDLSIHFFRAPAGEWVGFDTRVVLGPSGVGLTSSTLYDEDGPVGRSEQILTVRPLRAAGPGATPPAPGAPAAQPGRGR